MKFFKPSTPPPVPTSQWMRLLSRTGRDLGLEFHCTICGIQYRFLPIDYKVASHCGKTESLVADLSTLPTKKIGPLFLEDSFTGFAFEQDVDTDYECSDPEGNP